MKNEKVLRLYDAVYQYTDVLNDKALNILDEQLDAKGVYDGFEALMDDPLTDLPRLTATLMCEAMRQTLMECEDRCKECE
jgi:hypothetical protein